MKPHGTKENASSPRGRTMAATMMVLLDPPWRAVMPEIIRKFESSNPVSIGQFDHDRLMIRCIGPIVDLDASNARLQILADEDEVPTVRPF